MSDDLHLGEVVEGYAVLATELLKEWSPMVSALSTKVAAGNYQLDDAAADFSAGVKLVASSLFAIGSEAMDAVTVMTSSYSEQRLISGYGTDPTRASTVRSLMVKADLESITGRTLPKERVKPVPATLAVGATDFDLAVNGDGMKARTYDGIIVATDASGGVEEIKVSVTIG